MAGHRLIKVTKNHYPIDDAEIVGDDTSVSKLAHVVVTMTGSGLKSVQRKRLCIEQTNSYHASTTSVQDKY